MADRDFHTDEEDNRVFYKGRVYEILPFRIMVEPTLMDPQYTLQDLEDILIENNDKIWEIGK